jgi:hypothetical protein
MTLERDPPGEIRSAKRLCTHEEFGQVQPGEMRCVGVTWSNRDDSLKHRDEVIRPQSFPQCKGYIIKKAFQTARLHSSYW